MATADHYRRLNWNPEETEVLLEIWQKYQPALRSLKRNYHVYSRMTDDLKKRGIARTVKQVHMKVDSLTQKYRNIRINNPYQNLASLQWPFYKRVDEILSMQQRKRCDHSPSVRQNNNPQHAILLLTNPADLPQPSVSLVESSQQPSDLSQPLTSPNSMPQTVVPRLLLHQTTVLQMKSPAQAGTLKNSKHQTIAPKILFSQAASKILIPASSQNSSPNPSDMSKISVLQATVVDTSSPQNKSLKKNKSTVATKSETLSEDSSLPISPSKALPSQSEDFDLTLPNPDDFQLKIEPLSPRQEEPSSDAAMKEEKSPSPDTIPEIAELQSKVSQMNSDIKTELMHIARMEEDAISFLSQSLDNRIHIENIQTTSPEKSEPQENVKTENPLDVSSSLSEIADKTESFHEKTEPSPHHRIILKRELFSLPDSLMPRSEDLHMDVQIKDDSDVQIKDDSPGLKDNNEEEELHFDDEISSSQPIAPLIFHSQPPDPQISHSPTTDPQISHSQPTDPQISHSQPPAPQISHSQPPAPQISHSQSSAPHILQFQPTAPQISLSKPTAPQISFSQPMVPQILISQPSAQQVYYSQSIDPQISHSQPSSSHLSPSQPSPSYLFPSQPRDPQISQYQISVPPNYLSQPTILQISDLPPSNSSRENYRPLSPICINGETFVPLVPIAQPPPPPQPPPSQNTTEQSFLLQYRKYRRIYSFQKKKLKLLRKSLSIQKKMLKNQEKILQIITKRLA